MNDVLQVPSAALPSSGGYPLRRKEKCQPAKKVPTTIALYVERRRTKIDVRVMMIECTARIAKWGKAPQLFGKKV